MNTEEFIGLVFMPNQSLYYLLLLFSMIVYAIIYWKYYISIIDPSFLEVISSMFGFSVVLLLWFTDNISLHYFSSFLVSQIAFWMGFIYISKKRNSWSGSMLKVKDEKNMLKCIFYFFDSLCRYNNIRVYCFGYPYTGRITFGYNRQSSKRYGIFEPFFLS